MRLDEILQLVHLPYKWLNDHTATFEFNDKLFGIVLDTDQIELPTRELSFVNILFGIVIDPSKPITHENISTEITGFGKARTVMTTVGYACKDNNIIRNYDIMVVAAADQLKQKRIGMYCMAIFELSRYFKEHCYSYRAHPKGAILVVQSKVELTQDEIEYIGTNMLDK
jgi:hypothetical protein